MSERINFYGIERVGPCGSQHDGAQYHPRYAQSEWDYYRGLERRRNLQAFCWLCFVLACLVGGFYFVVAA